jgi:hypothetical protein
MATIDVLKDHGIRAWYARTEIRGAQQWHDEIGKALNRCDWFVIYLSRNAVKSRWVKRELLYALNSARYDNRIVPVLSESCDFEQLSWTLSSIEFVDLRDSVSEGHRALLHVWGVSPQK